MDIIKTHNQTIEKALKNEVLSENISEILELEEIIYLNRLKLTMNCFSIEATLSRFLDEFPNVSEDYKEHINSINKQENDMKIKIDVTLCNALKSMPEEIKSFILSSLSIVKTSPTWGKLANIFRDSEPQSKI